MKKIILSAVCLSLILTGCKKNEVNVKNSSDSIEKQSSVTEKPVAEDSKPVQIEKKVKVDFDFPSMNYNLVSGILFDILIAPEKYENKTARFSGEFHSQEHEGQRYYSAVVWDPTGCCPTGLGFIPSENIANPELYIENGTSITVTGKFQNIKIQDDEELKFFATEITLNQN